MNAQEPKLPKKINRGFSVKKWLRMQELDSKMEECELTEQEYAELTSLTDAYEKYCVQHIRLINRLSTAQTCQSN